MRGSPEKQKAKSEQLRRRQIESTLNELHRLQAEIYELNVPENPHASAPVKKEVKQLTYLYENMTKPKTKNALDIRKQDIEKALHLIEKTTPGESAAKVDSRKLGKVVREMFGGELEVGLIRQGEGKSGYLSADELYEFINYNEFDGFDPVRDSYNLFVDETGKFNFKKYREFSDILGLPPIANEQAFRDTLGLGPADTLAFEQFAAIMKNDIV